MQELIFIEFNKTLYEEYQKNRKLEVILYQMLVFQNEVMTSLDYFFLKYRESQL